MNRFDWLIVLTITLLIFGWIGGAIQIIRIFSICMLPITPIFYYHQKDHFIHHINLTGVFLLFYAFCLTVIYNKTYAWSTVSYVEWGFLLLNCNLLMSLLLFAQRAVHPQKSIAIGWMIFVLLTGLIGLREIITGTHLPTNSGQQELLEMGYGINGIMDKTYAAATFGNYNEYVTALCSALPFLTYLIYNAQSFKKMTVPLLCLLLASVIIVVNASRGGILCIALCGIVYLFYYKRTSFRYKWLFLSVLCLCIALAIHKWGELLFSQITQRMAATTFSESGRTRIWQESWQAIRETWGFGGGSGVFVNKFSPVSHSIILEILVLYGLPGLFVFGWLIWKIWIRRKGSLVSTKMVLTMVFIMFIPYSIINSNYLQYAFFWVFLASLLIFATRGKNIETV